MAYTKKYQSWFTDGGGEITDLTRTKYRVELLKLGAAAGVTEIKNMSASPLVISSVIASRGMDVVVIGSEATYSIQVEDVATVNDVFESQYKDWRMDVYNDDTSALIFRGYVQPENLSRTIYEPWIVIEINATDALRDLSQIRYTPEITPGSERVTAMAAIQGALSYIDIELPFRVKLGTYEAAKASTELALLNCYVDLRRFYSLVDGREENDTCLDVIEKILTPLGCQLRQVAGEYRIQNIREGDTFDYTFTWALSSVTRVAASDTVNIDEIRFTRGGELSKVAPVKVLDITHFNRNFGDSLVSNLNIFEGETSPWSIEFSLFEVDFEGRLVAEISDLELQDPDGNIIRRMELAATFEVEKVTDSDFLEFSFKAFARNTVGLGIDPADSTKGIRVLFTITTPEGEETIEQAITGSEQDYILRVPVLSTGQYNVSVGIRLVNPDTDYSGEIVFSLFDIRKRTEVDGKLVSDITFDTFHRHTSVQGKITEKKEIWFADSFTSGDLGRFTIIDGGNHVATENWNRYGKIENLSLIKTYAANYLGRRSAYTDHLSITLLDTAKALHPATICDFDGRKYLFAVYDRDYRTNVITAQLEEIIYTDVEFSSEVDGLDTVDGRGGRGVSSTSVDRGGVTDVFVAPTTYPQLEKLMIRQGGAARQVTMLKKINGLLSGGAVTYADSGYEFWVEPALFAVDGKVYEYKGTGMFPVQLPPADGFLSRFDIIVLKPGVINPDDTEPYQGVIDIVSGEARATPIKPVIQPSEATELTTILVIAGSGSFESQHYEAIVYDEYTEDEWSDDTIFTRRGTANIAVVNYEATDDPFHGMKHMSVQPDADNESEFGFEYSEDFDPSPYGVLVMAIKLSRPITVHEYIYAVSYPDFVASYPPDMLGSYLPDINRASTEWQVLQFPTRHLIEITGWLDLRTLRFVMTAGFPDMLVDYIKFTGGISQPFPVDYLRLEGDVFGEGLIKSPISTQLAEITTARTVGSTSKIPVLTIDAKGRVTALDEVDLAAGEAPPVIVASEVVYDEGGEWTLEDVEGATISTAETDNPYNGTKHIRVHTLTSASVDFLFSLPATPIDASSYTHLQFAIYVNESYSGITSSINIGDGLNEGVAYEFEITLVGAYQIFTVPFSDFTGMFPVGLGRVVFAFSGYTTEGGFDLDFIRFVKIGTPQTVEGDIYVDEAELSAVSTGTMPTVTNTNNVVNVALNRTDDESVTFKLGSMAAYKAHICEEDDLPSGWESVTDTIFMTYEPDEEEEEI